MGNIHLHPRVLFYRQGIDWIAHCLEFDLAGEGATQEDAFRQLNEVLAIQVDAASFREDPDLFRPADTEFFAMFEAGSDVSVGDLYVPRRGLVMDRTQSREYCQAV